MTKYTLSENDLFKHMCTMDPIYERYPAKKDVVFRSGDVRSTLDDQLMEKASNVKETALEVQEALLEKTISLSRSGNPASREELMNAMLHFFLGAGVDEDSTLWSCRRWSSSFHMQVKVCCSHRQPWQFLPGQEADSSIGLLQSPRV